MPQAAPWPQVVVWAVSPSQEAKEGPEARAVLRASSPRGKADRAGPAGPDPLLGEAAAHPGQVCSWAGLAACLGAGRLKAGRLGASCLGAGRLALSAGRRLQLAAALASAVRLLGQGPVPVVLTGSRLEEARRAANQGMEKLQGPKLLVVLQAPRAAVQLPRLPPLELVSAPWRQRRGNIFV
mmetsp:Transcript_40042/g.74639  ORF Transcript_40042/g.74639 Transcript_40042/m.74639 type:complete len:182 (-) Transcript_40042:19-564(-)